MIYWLTLVHLLYLIKASSGRTYFLKVSDLNIVCIKTWLKFFLHNKYRSITYSILSGCNFWEYLVLQKEMGYHEHVEEFWTKINRLPDTPKHYMYIPGKLKHFFWPSLGLGSTVDEFPESVVIGVAVRARAHLELVHGYHSLVSQDVTSVGHWLRLLVVRGRLKFKG